MTYKSCEIVWLSGVQTDIGAAPGAGQRADAAKTTPGYYLALWPTSARKHLSAPTLLGPFQTLPQAELLATSVRALALVESPPAEWQALRESGDGMAGCLPPPGWALSHGAAA